MEKKSNEKTKSVLSETIQSIQEESVEVKVLAKRIKKIIDSSLCHQFNIGSDVAKETLSMLIALGIKDHDMKGEKYD